jgi:ABC-2 type transport system ATP-binding protein
MTLSIEVDKLRVRYENVVALDDVSFDLAGGKIYGLLGRNGAGKSTLLSVLAGFRKASGGAVRIDGRPVFENRTVTRRVCLVRDTGELLGTDTGKTALEFAEHLRPGWDGDYAARLVERFEVPLGKNVSALSRGKRSALGVVIGLASRAPVTMFDESHLGMDAPARYAFYEELLADYTERPRTIVFSTHLIEEVAPLFEETLIIDRGRVLLHEETELLRTRGATVTGPEAAVDRFVAGSTVLGEKRLGRTKSVTIYGEIDEAQRRKAQEADLDLEPVALQDLFVHLTEPTAGREGGA